MNSQLVTLVDLYQDTLEQIASDVAGLSATEASLPTGCDGWTLHDQISHVVGLEQSLSGADEPTVEVPSYEHVNGEVGEYMETHVEARRHLPVQAVIDELNGLIPRRLAQVRAQAAEGDIDVRSALGGMRPLSKTLPIRIMDLYAHELDIARALGRTPRTNGSVADMSMKQAMGAWSGLLPHRVKDHCSLTISVTAPDELEHSIQFGASDEDADDSADAPHARLQASRDTIFKLAFGRGNVDDVLGEATITGDQSVIEAIKPFLAFTP